MVSKLRQSVKCGREMLINPSECIRNLVATIAEQHGDLDK